MDLTRLFASSDSVPLLRSLDAMAPLLRAMPRREHAKYVDIWRKARELSRKEIWPRTLANEHRMHEDPRYVDLRFLEKAGRRGLFSMSCFPAFGGGGLGSTAIALVMEELCAGCAGMGNLVGAHHLGLSGVLCSLNLHLSARIQKEIVRSEREAAPISLAAAVTEPQAGSDVEDERHLATAKIACSATRVEGGYRLNGTKVFISNGTFARYVVVGAATDRKRPDKTWTMFLVDATSPGFSVPRVESKMGMKANPAAELSLDEVFVSDEMMLSNAVGDGAEWTEVVLGASRGPVGGIATGIARGALERFLYYTTIRVKNGTPLVESESIQVELGDLFGKIGVCRSTYLSAALAFDRLGFGAMLSDRMLSAMALPGAGGVLRRFSSSRAPKAMLRKSLEQRFGKQRGVVLANASLAKQNCSDMAMEIVSRIMDLMGPDALLPEWEIEKAYRDVKLTQIYEGTNQINRAAIFEKGVRS